MILRSSETRAVTNHITTSTAQENGYIGSMKKVEGLASKIHMHKSIGISGDMEKKTVDIAAKNPREGYGPPFSTWSLRALAAAYLFDQNSI